MKKFYIAPETELIDLSLCGPLALSTNEDDDERAPQTAKDREMFEEYLWNTENEKVNSLW